MLDFVQEIDKFNFRVTKLFLHDTKDVVLKDISTTFEIHYIKNLITSFNNCGIVDSKYFNVNNYKVLESFEFNSCLNQKISVDINGDIRNCPSMPKKFGNIVQDSLTDALENNNFKEFWKIPKTKITTCKDCEYKFICTDCRAFTENPEDKFSKPLKCGYDPYSNKWEDWSSNPLKKKVMELYKIIEK